MWQDGGVEVGQRSIADTISPDHEIALTPVLINDSQQPMGEAKTPEPVKAEASQPRKPKLEPPRYDQ
jgi:hypothetical protein